MNSSFEGKRILITGGAGFIGSNLCSHFLEKGANVVCLDNFSTGSKANLTTLLDSQNFSLVEGDIRSLEDCLKAVEGCDYVLHQAALGSVPRSIKDPVTSTDVNIGGFVKILHASVEKGVKRFVFAASSSTYGDHPGLPKIEHKIGKALSPYGITKYVDELYAENFSNIYGIETIGLRYFNVFGKRQNPNGAYAAVIPKFIQLMMDGESPIINGDGSYSRDFTYIDNVIHANEQALIVDSDTLKERISNYRSSHSILPENDDTINEIFNVAFGDRTTLNELYQYLNDELVKYNPDIASIAPIHGTPREGDIPHSLASIEKGKTILGYVPKYDVKKGISLAIDWYWNNLSNNHK